MELDARCALVTGASQGIGRELARLLVERGCRVVAVGRNAAALGALSGELGPAVTPWPVDLADAAQTAALAEQLPVRCPTLSLVINNAGVQTLADLTQDGADPALLVTLRAEIETNFTAVVTLCAALLPHLRRQPSAAIVNVTSGLALAPKRSAPVYCATKAGIRSFTKALRYQCEQSAPHVAVVEALPPLVDTAMTRGRGRGKISAAQAASEIVRGVAAGLHEIYVGKSKLLRVVDRLAPSAAAAVMRNL